MIQTKTKSHSFTQKLAVAGSLFLALGTTTLAAMAAQGAFRTYTANDPVGRNVVMIESHAPLETILTRTGAVTATISGDLANIFKDSTARFEVDLTKLETGIPVRDEHMRSESWLNTEKFPNAVFTLTKLTQIDRSADTTLRPGVERTVMAEGTMQLRGVTKPLSTRVTLKSIPGDKDTAARLEGDLLHVKASFPIKLSDFGIEVPAMAQLKVANEETVTVDVFANTGNQAPATQPASAPATPATNDLQPVTAPAEATPLAIPEKVTKLLTKDLIVGTGTEAKKGKKVTVNYRGTLTNGTVFDESYSRGEPFTFNLGAGQVIEGWDKGVAGMKVGGKRQLIIPAKMAYGNVSPAPTIPANSPLVFTVELLGVN